MVLNDEPAGEATEGATERAMRPRVMPDLLRDLAGDILGGRYAPGEMLPRETDMGGQYGVSRTVIREALKVLAAKGLVSSRPRIGTVVCDREDWNILDPQLIDWQPPGALDQAMLDSILETRRAIEPLVAELAATRASMQEIADLEAAWRGMAEAGEDLPQFLRSDIAFHHILYKAGHNPIFRQIGKLIDAALSFALETSGTRSSDHWAGAIRLHGELVEALRLRDPVRARDAANAILDRAAQDLHAARQEQTRTGQEDQ